MWAAYVLAAAPKLGFDSTRMILLAWMQTQDASVLQTLVDKVFQEALMLTQLSAQAKAVSGAANDTSGVPHHLISMYAFKSLAVLP